MIGGKDVLVDKKANKLEVEKEIISEEFSDVIIGGKKALPFKKGNKLEDPIEDCTHPTAN